MLLSSVSTIEELKTNTNTEVFSKTLQENDGGTNDGGTNDGGIQITQHKQL